MDISLFRGDCKCSYWALYVLLLHLCFIVILCRLWANKLIDWFVYLLFIVLIIYTFNMLIYANFTYQCLRFVFSVLFALCDIVHCICIVLTIMYWNTCWYALLTWVTCHMNRVYCSSSKQRCGHWHYMDTLGLIVCLISLWINLLQKDSHLMFSALVCSSLLKCLT